MLTRLIATLLATPAPRPDPLLAVAHIVLKRFPHFSGMRRNSLMHIVYAAQIAAIEQTGRPLFEDEFEAATVGPTIPRLIEDLRRHTPRCADPAHLCALDADQTRLVEAVCASLAGVTAGRLVGMTSAQDGPWAMRYRPSGDVDRGPRIPLRAMRRDRPRAMPEAMAA